MTRTTKGERATVIIVRGWDSDTLGVTLNVNRAIEIVNDGHHEVHAMPTENGPSYTDLDEKTVQAANTMIPGIIITYYDDDGNPCFDLIDGNHRFEKARRRGYTYFGVYALTPDEARECEINVPADAKPRRYRNYWDG